MSRPSSTSSPATATVRSWSRRSRRARRLLDVFLSRQRSRGFLCNALRALLSSSRDLLSMPGRGGAIPVVQHLGGQNGIQQESGDISVQNKLVIHLLQGRVDSHQAAEQVVEDGEGGQLTCATLAVHGQDLGELACDAECACTSLEASHLSIADKRVRDDQGVDGAASGGEECTSLCAPVGVG